VKVSDVQAEFNRRYIANSTDPAKADNAKRMALKRAIDSLPLSEFSAGEAEGTEWIWKLK
jgi:hypothetical protein